MDALARSPAEGKENKDTTKMGSVADLVELVNTTVGKHFRCCICFSILEDPVMLPCNHPLCRGCAVQCLRQHRRCPQCLTEIPNLRMLQGRNKWITEMVDSLRDSLNEVGVSLTQHAPVPSMYRNARPPAPRARPRARARARGRASEASSSRAPSPPSPVSCGGGGGRGGDSEAKRNDGGGASRKRSPPVRPPASAMPAARPPPARRGRPRAGEGDTRGQSSSHLSGLGGAGSNPPRGVHAGQEDGRSEEALPPGSTSGSAAAPSAPTPPPPQPLVVGDLVNVDHRTWPGINKYGGVGFVCAVSDPQATSYDVKYSVTQKVDRGVEARFVHPYAFPQEVVGNRSRRGAGGRAGGRATGGSGGLLSPRGRVPVGQAAVASASPSLPTYAAPAPQPPSPPRNTGGLGHATGRATPGSESERNDDVDSDMTISVADDAEDGESTDADMGDFGGGSDGEDSEEGAPMEEETEQAEGRAETRDSQVLPRDDDGEEETFPHEQEPTAPASSNIRSAEGRGDGREAATESRPVPLPNLPWHPSGSDVRYGEEHRRRELQSLQLTADSIVGASCRAASSTRAPVRVDGEGQGNITDSAPPFSRNPDLTPAVPGASPSPNSIHQPPSPSQEGVPRRSEGVRDSSVERAETVVSHERYPPASPARSRPPPETERAESLVDQPEPPSHSSFVCSPFSRPARVAAAVGPQRTPRQAMPPPPPPPPPSPTPPPKRPPFASVLATPPPPRPPLLSEARSYKVGDLVDVLCRTSPGVNKEGGVARVTKVSPEGTYSVKYLVRQGTEKGVAAAILSPYPLDDGGTGDAGDGDTCAGGGTHGRDARRSDAASSLPSGAGAQVRRTPRSNKGSCPPDAAAGQANAACLSYLLGETQHPELDLDPDLGEGLDPDEGNPEEAKRRQEAATATAYEGAHVAAPDVINPARGKAKGHGKGRESGRGGRGRGGKSSNGGERKTGGEAKSGGSNCTKGNAGDGSAQGGGGGPAQEGQLLRRHGGVVSLAAGSQSEGENTVVATTGPDLGDRSGDGTRSRGHESRPAAKLRDDPPAHVVAGTGAAVDKTSRPRVGSAAITGSSRSSSSSRVGGGEVAPGDTRRGRAKGAVLTFTALEDDMVALAKSLAKRHGWRVEPKYTEDVTHVVCGVVPQTSKAKLRSAKFLRAVASGRWVVNEGWLQECKRRGERAGEEGFEVSGDRKSTVPSAPRRSRLAHADAERPGLFRGTMFYFRGHFGTESPPQSELEPMLLDNGGTVAGTVDALFRRQPGEGGGSGSGGGGRRDGSSTSSSGSWRPPRVIIFQPSASSREEDRRALARELAVHSKAGVSTGSEGGGSGGSRRDWDAVEVVKPLWLVDSVGSFRVLQPTVLHRVDLPDVTRVAREP